MKRIISTLMAALLLSACTGDKVQNLVGPASPSTGSAGVTSISVAAPSSMGTSFQLIATASMTDHTTRDVTTIATWDSSNPSIAQVSSTGLVTVTGLGGVDVHATYSGIIGSLSLNVNPHPATLALSGYVHEMAPTEHPLAGVVIQMMSGPNTGMTTTTDAEGVYRLALDPGVAVVQFGRDGYYTHQISNLTLSGNTDIYVWLYPTPPTNTNGASATARCNDGSWSWASSQDQACTDSGGIAYVVCPGPLCQAAPSEHSQGISRRTS